MTDVPESNLKDSTPFNMWLSTLLRIDNLRKRSVEAKLQRNYQLWCDLLDSQYGELSCIVELKEDEKERVKKQRRKFYDDLTEHNNSGFKCRKRSVGGRVVIDEGKCKHVSGEFFWTLDNYDVCLNELFQNYKVMMPSRQDPNVAFKMGRG